PKKTQDRAPRESYRFLPIEDSLDPFPAGGVLRSIDIVCIQQDVCIDQDHRRAGPSNSSSNCSIFERSIPGRRPMDRAFTRKGVRLDAGFAATKDLRKCSFTTSLKERPVRRVSDSSLRYTSSSRVRVVLMHLDA